MWTKLDVSIRSRTKDTNKMENRTSLAEQQRLAWTWTSSYTTSAKKNLSLSDCCEPDEGFDRLITQLTAMGW